MNQRAGDVSFLDGRVQLLRLSTADAGDEVGEMIAAGPPAGPGLLVGAEPAFIAEAVFVAPGQVTVRSVEDVADRVVAIEQAVAADRGDTIREPDAEPPPRDIDLMEPLVAKVPVPCLPDPVPVVMKAVAGERLQRRRPGPEVIVDSTGHGFGRRSSNRVPSLEAQPPRQIDPAKGAFVQLVDRLDLRGSRAALCAVLHDPVVLLCGAHQLASFPQVM